MTRLIPVIGHTRHLPDKPRLIDNDVHQRLWNEFVGNVLAMELESALSELLPDYGRAGIERLEQTY